MGFGLASFRGCSALRGAAPWGRRSEAEERESRVGEERERERRKRCDFVLADVRIPLDLIKSGARRPARHPAPPHCRAGPGVGGARVAARGGRGALDFLPLSLSAVGLVGLLLVYSRVCVGPGGCERRSERKECVLRRGQGLRRLDGRLGYFRDRGRNGATCSFFRALLRSWCGGIP
jgi:hypothetical protein